MLPLTWPSPALRRRTGLLLTWDLTWYWTTWHKIPLDFTDWQHFNENLHVEHCIVVQGKTRHSDWRSYLNWIRNIRHFWNISNRELNFINSNEAMLELLVFRQIDWVYNNWNARLNHQVSTDCPVSHHLISPGRSRANLNLSWRWRPDSHGHGCWVSSNEDLLHEDHVCGGRSQGLPDVDTPVNMMETHMATDTDMYDWHITFYSTFQWEGKN